MDMQRFAQRWTQGHEEAAQQEGWHLIAVRDLATLGITVGVRAAPTDVTQPLNDDEARAMVRCGTGAHHTAAREIIYAASPEEWRRMEDDYARIYGPMLALDEPEDDPINPGHRHELCDRSHVLSVLFEETIANHRAAETCTDEIEQVRTAINNLHQRAGALAFDHEEQP